MSNQSRGKSFSFNQQSRSLRDNQTKNGHKKRCLSFHLPPIVSLDESNSGSRSSSVDNNIQTFHHYGHRDIKAFDNGDFKVSSLIILKTNFHFHKYFYIILGT